MENLVWGNIGCNLFGCVLAFSALAFYVQNAQMCNRLAEAGINGTGNNFSGSSAAYNNNASGNASNGTGAPTCGTAEANYFSFMAVLTLAILVGHLSSTAASYNFLVHLHNLVTAMPLGAMGVHNDFAPMGYSASPADPPAPPPPPPAVDPYGAGPLTMTAQQQEEANNAADQSWAGSAQQQQQQSDQDSPPIQEPATVGKKSGGKKKKAAAAAAAAVAAATAAAQSSTSQPASPDNEEEGVEMR